MSKHSPPEPNDDALDQLLSHADPARNCDLTPSIDRLKSGLGFQPLIRTKGGMGFQPVIRRFTLAAAILLSLGGSLWWLTRFSEPDKIVFEDSAIKESNSLPAIPESSSETAFPADLSSNKNETVASPAGKQLERVIRVTSIQQLFQELAERKPRQRFPEIELDETALQIELGQWLAEWSRESPEQRQKLAATWNENRSYWLPWAKNWCGSWDDQAINVTAVDAITTDERAAAVPFLTKFIDNETLRQHVWGRICQFGSAHQLAELLPVAKTCDEVQTLAAALIRDASPQSTDLLMSMVAQASCRQAIQRLKIEWPNRHAEHCWTTLTSAASDAQTATAAILLSIIPSPQIDVWLAENMRIGRHQLQVVSVLLLRETSAARRLLAGGHGNKVLASNLPSAKQQVFRWSLMLGNASILSPKVCEQCTVSS